MGTNYIAPTWRMPENKNKNKTSNYSIAFRRGDATGTSIICDKNDLGPLVSIENSYSISAWIKIATENVSTVQGIISADDPTSGGNVGWLLYRYQTQLRIGAVQQGQTDRSILNTPNFFTQQDENQWTHICVTSDGTTNYFFKNGVFVSNGTIATGGPTGVRPLSLFTNGNDIRIGNTLGVGDRRFSGFMSDISIFDYDISNSNANDDTNLVNVIYNQTLTPVSLSSPAIAFWPLGDDSNVSESITGGGYARKPSFPNISSNTNNVFDFSGTTVPSFIMIGNQLKAGGLNEMGKTGVQKFSVSLWFYLPNYSGSTPGAQGLWGYNYGDNQGSGFFIWKKATNSGELIVQIGKHGATSNFGRFEIPATSVPLQKWHHIVAVFDGSQNAQTDKLKVYLNGSAAPGQYQNQANIPALLPNGRNSVSTGTTNQLMRNFYLGNLEINTGGGTVGSITNSYQLKGKLANVQMWGQLLGRPNAALSAAQVATLYNNGHPLETTPPLSTNLTFWSKLNQDSNFDQFNWNHFPKAQPPIRDWQIVDARTEINETFDLGLTSQIRNFQLANQFSADAFQNGITISAWVRTPRSFNNSGQIIFGNNHPSVTSERGFNFGIDGFSNAGSVGFNTPANDPLNYFFFPENGDGMLNFITKLINPTTGVVAEGVSILQNFGTREDSNVADGRWHHVVFTWDSQGFDASGRKMRLFIDGKYVSGAAGFAIGSGFRISIPGGDFKPCIGSGGFGATNGPTTSNVLRPIGGANNISYNPGSGTLQGNRIVRSSVANVQIWNKGLNPSSNSDYDVGLPNTGRSVTSGPILELFNNGVPRVSNIPESSNLILWHKLDRSTSNFNANSARWVCTDLSGSNNTATGNFNINRDLLINNSVGYYNGMSRNLTLDNLKLDKTAIYRSTPFSNYSIGFRDPNPGGSAQSLSVLIGNAADITISCFIYIRSANTANKAPIINNAYSTGPQFQSYKFQIEALNTNSPELKFYARNPIDTSAYAIATAVLGSGNNPSLSLNSWHHVAITKDNATVKLYFDGKELTSSNSGPAFPNNLNNPNPNLDEIARSDGGELNGNLSHLCIWFDTLTDAEIKEVYNNNVSQDLTKFLPAPRYWYPMDENWTYQNIQLNGNLIIRNVFDSGTGSDTNLKTLNMRNVDIEAKAPGSYANAVSENTNIQGFLPDNGDLRGDMKNSLYNAKSVGFADYGNPSAGDGRARPAPSGRSTLVP